MKPNFKKKGSVRRPAAEIQDYLLESIAAGHRRDLVTFTAEKLGLTRQGIYLHVRRLIDEEKIVAVGKTRSRTYSLKHQTKSMDLDITPELEEHVVWRDYIQPLLPTLRKNIFDICFHGFTEIFNNVKDHSEGTTSRITISQSPISLTIEVDDNGVGIFNKLKEKFRFDDEHHAALELAKGKLTTDKQRHSGEGIFFSSRMFDLFTIASRGFIFVHEENDWILKNEELENTIGTSVRMTINLKSSRTAKSVFDKFATDEDYGFVRTVVPIKLAKYGDENLVSRSQAKRVLARLDRFQVVVLDFKDVETIGQAFADELFRVFNLSNPDIQLQAINANNYVTRMIDRVKSSA